MIPKTILLVEDDSLIALSEKLHLEDEGYRVLHAATGEEALELVGREHVDLILLDVLLGGGLDGIETAKRLPSEPEIPVIFLTSHSERAVAERISELLPYGYLVKESDYSMLDASIKIAFQRHAVARDLERKDAALRRSEERYRRDERIGHIGNWEYDLVTHRLWASEEARRIFGFDLDLPDFSIDEIAKCIPERTRIMLGIVELIKHGGEYRLEYEIHPRKGGEPRLIWSVAEVMRDARGRPVLVEGVIQDVTEAKRAEERIRRLLEEKELILREVHHRVKNNLNTVLSLISLQVDALDDELARTVLRDAEIRVHSMSSLYDKLYRSPAVGRTSLGEYFPALAEEIVGMFPPEPRVRIDTRIEDIVLGEKQLTPLGIILNELICNAMKHAFAGRSDGLIEIRAARRGDLVSIELSDDGVGLPSEGAERHSGFGMRLVTTLVDQLSGTLEVSNARGTKYSILFEPAGP
jgi:PAS domain S-box-containing protein